MVRFNPHSGRNRPGSVGRPDDARMPERFVTYHELSTKYDVWYSRAHLLRLIKAGTFPCPEKLGAGRIGWRVEDMEAWVRSRPVVSYAPPPEKRWRAPVAVTTEADATQ